MAENTHAKLSPSSANRWFECTASVALSSQVPSKQTSFASEGSAAHSLAEKCLVRRKNPISFVGEVITVGKEIFPVTEDMASDVSVYVMEVMKYASKKYNPNIKDNFEAEKRLSLAWLGFPEIFGTADCVLPDTANRILHIFDFKYGVGDPVSAEDNKQLNIYGLGGLGEYGVDNFDFVHFHIVQPRCYNPSVPESEVSIRELLEWANSTLVSVYKEIKTEPKYCANPVTCKYCPAKHICPELAEKHKAVACIKEKTSALSMELNLPEVGQLSKEQIATIIANKKIVEKFMDEVSSYANALALNGETFPGLKLIQGRKGNRKWINEEAVFEMFEEKYGEKIFKKKILTPKQMEDILSSDDLTLAKTMETQSEGRIYLVSEKEKGKAIEIKDPTESMLEEFYGKNLAMDSAQQELFGDVAEE